MTSSNSHDADQCLLHPTVLPVDKLNALCDEIRTRRSGPGGQHRNKTESAVVLTHRATGISAEANERRSQHENRRVALNRLRMNLALEFRGEFASQPVPSQLWSSRCANRKIKVSASHDDFAALLAEVLDRIFANDFNVSSVAEFLDCSTSQLIKFLKTEPRALQIVNNNRAELGLHRLK
jgi:hypothetical protein